MTKIDKLKKFLKENYQGTQAFDTRNLVGDSMEVVYAEDGIAVEYCYNWDYIEIFELTKEEFIDLLDSEKERIEID